MDAGAPGNEKAGDGSRRSELSREMNRAVRLILLLLLLLLFSAGARAHPILQNPVWIESATDGLTIKLDVSVRELIVVQGLPQSAEGLVDLDEAIERADRHEGYLLDHFQVKGDGVLLKGTVTAIVPPKVIGTGLEGPDNAHFRYTVDYKFALPPAVLTFSQNMCVEFPSAPGVPWDLSYAYRYGPKGETPRKFGPLRRDQELSFTTGFERVRTPMPGMLLAMWAVFIFVTVFGSSFLAGSPSPVTIALILWIAGMVAGKFLPASPPLWLATLLSGAVTILTAADNIHRPVSGPTRRRLALLWSGFLSFGLAAGLQERVFPHLDQWWRVSPLIAAAGASLAGAAVLAFAKRSSPRGAAFMVQLCSLAGCGGAIWLMLSLLEVL